jgi:TonB family protein
MLARRGMHGKVVCQLIVNKNNGEVTEVKVLKRSRFQQLDAACVMAGFNWKFRPGTVSQVTIPFELELRGYAKEIHR